MTLSTGRKRREIAWKMPSIVAALVLIGIGAIIYLWYHPYSTGTKQSSTSQQAKKPVPTPTSLASKALFMGDVYWGRNINVWSQASPLKTAYPFSRLNEFHREKYDAWVADLECPVVPGVHLTAAEEEATLSFNCDPSYLPEAAKWFTIFSNANNHSDNQGGEQGLETTREQLDKNGIQYFGSFDPEMLSDVCEVISFPVHVTMSDKTTAKRFLPVALCGYHGVFKTPSAASLAVMQRYSQIMPVIAYPHSGAEYQPAPDQIKTNLYRAMIDNGADVVLGDHPHWVQTTEAYKGHLIVYAMNNFIFDQQFNLEVTRAAVVDLDLTLRQGADASELAKWLAIGDECKAFHDNCLQKAEAEHLTKLDLDWHFSIIGSRDDGHLAHPASESDTAAILNRLNWSQTIKQLQSPYSGT